MCRPPPPIWYAKIVGRGSEFAELRKGQFHHHLERGRGSKYSDEVKFSISCSQICLTQSSMIKSHPISWRSGYIIRVHGLERGQIWEISSHAPNSKGEQEMGIGPEGEPMTRSVLLGDFWSGTMLILNKYSLTSWVPAFHLVLVAYLERTIRTCPCSGKRYCRQHEGGEAFWARISPTAIFLLFPFLSVFSLCARKVRLSVVNWRSQSWGGSKIVGSTPSSPFCFHRVTIWSMKQYCF